MTNRGVHGLSAAFLAAALGLWAVQAAAQSGAAYPTKPVRIIVSFPPGAILDATARTLGQEVGNSIGQPVIVENRPGASFIIGMVACAKAAPDGYTLCLNTNSYNELVFTNLPYDPDRDFAPIIHLAWVQSMLVAKGNAPFGSIRELVAFSKARPGAVNWGTWGPATSPDIHLRWITTQMGVDITAVAYKGGAQTVPALLAGEIDITFMAVGPLLPLLKTGKLRPIAVVGNRRVPSLPDVPSLAEEGANSGLMGWFGLFAPAMTPRPIIDRLNAEFAKAMRAPGVQDFFRTQTLDAIGGSADEFAKFVKADRENMAKVFRTIGIRPTPAP